MATLIAYSDAQYARSVRASVASGEWKSPPEPDAEHSINLRKAKCITRLKESKTEVQNVCNKILIR